MTPQLTKIITAAIHANEPCPSNIDMSRTLGCDNKAVWRALKAMENEGAIVVQRLNNQRVITIPGVGSTAATMGPKRRYDRASTPNVDHMERVERWCCPRCGARSGACAHTAVGLTTHGRTAWGNV